MSRNPDWSRRGFLSAKGLAASAGGLIGSLMTEEQNAACDLPASVKHWCFARRAMGCEFTVYLPPLSQDELAVAEAALDEIEATENLLSVYRADSTMSYVNHHAAKGPVRVNHVLFQLLRRAGELSSATAGAFDVSAGALVNAWGFLTGPKRVPTDAERTAAMACSGMDHVVFDDDAMTVHFLVDGLVINFGSIGKGFGIDRAFLRLMQDFEIGCAMIQGGESSLRAIGSPAGDGKGWLVGIRNPYHRERRVATVRLHNRSMGTSGNANQYFEHSGHRYGHVLDPRTGKPADELASVSVLAPDAATADALATGLFVMGLDKAADFCQNHADIGALLVLRSQRPGDTTEQPRVVTFNLPPEDVDLSPR